jgi:uncharacterized protein
VLDIYNISSYHEIIQQRIEMTHMFTYTGKMALITGASTGIGRAFALELAKRGMSVILVARSEDKLRVLATEIAKTYKVRAEVIVSDLGEAGAAQDVYQQVEQRKLAVDLLVNNAGLGASGLFESFPAERHHQQVMVNMAALVEMSHVFLPSLLKRPGETAIINLASTLAFQPVPYMSVYGATKAFVLSFSEALAEENRGRGLRVQALCPGLTDTPFLQVPGQGVERNAGRTAEQVVATSLYALERNQVVVVDGAQNAWVSELYRVLPRWLMARVMGSALRPKDAAQGQTAARSH